MKTFIETLKCILIILSLLFVFFPWIAMLIDFVWVFLTNNTATNIMWSAQGSWRLIIGVFWPIVLGGLAACFCSEEYA